jgi:excisionase family DNA binding protein
LATNGAGSSAVEARKRDEEMLKKVTEVAKQLSLSISKTYELVECGEIGCHRMGGAIRISEEQVAEYLESTKRERGSSRRSSPRTPRPSLKNFSL